MRINGTPMQSCSALVDDFPQPITLQPMAKFTVIRDLIIDRQRMFDALKDIKGWVPIDGTHDLGAGPKQTPTDQTWMYVISRCMTCGCCLEACPQINGRSEFMGASAIAQARLFNAHPTGATIAAERLDALMKPGGVADCGNAQNCVQVCPKEIPLTQSISDMGRQTIIYGFKRFFREPDVKM
jgi:succinate dehydrogenase / fumarate reductase iron-sulfur subunit